jgi:hypothetical protein
MGIIMSYLTLYQSLDLRDVKGKVFGMWIADIDGKDGQLSMTAGNP